MLLTAATLWGQTDPREMHFHSLIPLGAEAYQVQGDKWRGMITLLASAVNPQFEGMSRHEANKRDALFSPDGEKLKTYPGRVSFRVTASYRTRFVEASPFPIGATGEQNDYLLHLKFRVVVFDGLRQTVVEPESVEMIGVPGDVPYDERIFRVLVDLSKFPVRDRVVLEVQDPNGGRICKFHLDLL